MPATFFKPSEIANLSVYGQNFNQWESVWAQERWCEAFSYFRFTTAEGPPIRPDWKDIVVQPCASFFLTLGGVPAMTGRVMQRQVAYDAERHQVMIIGKSASFWGFKSHIKLKEANMDGMNIKQMADHLLNQYGVGVELLGDVNLAPFDKVQGSPGDNIWHFLDGRARERHVALSNYANGNAVLIGTHGSPDVAVLKEGVNIKKMQVTFSIEDTWQEIQAVGQVNGSNEQSGPDANEQEADSSGSSCAACTLVVPMEDPVKSVAELQWRADFEAHWTDATQIVANITVQGWFTPSGNLWHAGQSVFVDSPMAPLSQSMKIKTCTWQQDSENGTETVLECVWPKMGLNDYSIDVSDVDAEPSATAVVPQPTNPPATPQNVPTVTVPPPYQPSPIVQQSLGQQLGLGSISPSLAQQLGIQNIGQ
jgi:prophage tail gpP-like protein